MPTWPLAALVFPLGYLPLLVTDSRLVRPIVLVPLALALFAVWARRLPPPRLALLAGIFLALFALSHVVSALTVPAVGIGLAAALFALAARRSELSARGGTPRRRPSSPRRPRPSSTHAGRP